jgi:hypothetical protein
MPAAETFLVVFNIILEVGILVVFGIDDEFDIADKCEIVDEVARRKT